MSDGLRDTNRSNAFAGPSGSRLPCSHCWSVLELMQMAFENWSWVIPVFFLNPARVSGALAGQRILAEDGSK